MRRVVVTGLGAVSALGLSARESFKALLAGESAARPKTFLQPSGEPLSISLSCEVDERFSPEKLFGRRDAEHMDRFTHFACAAADEAVKDARFSGAYPSDRVAVVVGSGLGGIGSLLGAAETFRQKGARQVSPFTVPKILPSIAAGWVSMRLGLSGPNLAPATACAASAHAIAQAAELIVQGQADAALAGGAEAPISPVGIASFAAMRTLTRTTCRPFDKERDGFVLGEGGAMLVLEERESALARGATIYAELGGWGLSGDAHHLTAPLPDGAGCARAMRLALSRAGLAPEAVDYINAHATGTPTGDPAEARAILSLFGDRPFVVSTKGASGHLLGGAGALEAVFVILSLAEGVLPPTAGLKEVDPECALRHVIERAQKTPIRVALSNSMGFGGTNASLLFCHQEFAGG